ncbi:Imm1 family immunity protein [Actinokineospora sp.]|uniref:Imm1 family immunity protein n=1 Tax=Actinokineospora sp. TaxID=1872133 RepID=UPI004037C212
MVALAAYYLREPVTIRTGDELDGLLDRVLDDGMNYQVPPLIELSHRGESGWFIVQIGINVKQNRGFIAHAGPMGSVLSSDGTTDTAMVEYDYMGHVREIPRNAEITLSVVRRAVHQVLASNGARPTDITWQQVD